MEKMGGRQLMIDGSDTGQLVVNNAENVILFTSSATCPPSFALLSGEIPVRVQ